MKERDLHGGWLVAGWLASTLAAVGSLLTLSWLESRGYPGVVEVVAVFSWIVLAALAVVMTIATLAWVWERDR